MNDLDSILDQAQQGITQYLNHALEQQRIDQTQFNTALEHTFPNLKNWLTSTHIDQISPGLKEGICKAVANKQWEALVNAYRQSVRFGTGGIRGMMAFDRESIVQLKEEGIHAPILKGPNTINDVVLLLTSVGVAKFGKAQKPQFNKIVIGYDSRIRGHDLAAAVAQLFLANDYTVYFFDAPCPYPEVTFAIPYRSNDSAQKSIQADIGILISASHNDYRYNGYKLSCANGSQFDPIQRDEMYNKYIVKSVFKDISKPCTFADAPKDRLFFLGGDQPLPDYDYAGKENNLINIHDRHRDHVRSFILMKDLEAKQKASSNPLQIGYCAFHGVGRLAVPRLLTKIGFDESHIKSIHENGLDDLNGLFPSFCSDPGREQQPDPGDKRAAETAVAAFKKEYSASDFQNMDILIGTDPDADRCGIVVKVPKEQRHVYDAQYYKDLENNQVKKNLEQYKDYTMLSADDAWTLLLWYRLEQEKKANNGVLVDADKKFIVLSMTTSDAISRIARKYELGSVTTWVGFASLAAATNMVWEGRTDKVLKLIDGRDDVTGGPDNNYLCHDTVSRCDAMDHGKRSINIAAMEQSNGFSLLGAPPPDNRSLGQGGHVRDKDGTLAAVLMAEIAAWAKLDGTSLIELLDKHIYLDPDIGLFCNLYEPDPLDGEYPGIEGDRLKKAILRRALGYYQLAQAGDLEIGGKLVKNATIFRTGKYDAIYPQTFDFAFPDEGMRFFFDDEKLQHVTIRPSGTGNSLRFHIQLHAKPSNYDQLVKSKIRLRKEGNRIMNDIRRFLKAPR